MWRSTTLNRVQDNLQFSGTDMNFQATKITQLPCFFDKEAIECGPRSLTVLLMLVCDFKRLEPLLNEWIIKDFD